MDYLQILFFLLIGIALVAVGYILIAKPIQGNPLVAAVLAGLFAGYTAVQIAQEGVMMFFTNHASNMTGIQVWWDIIMVLVVALFFIMPRARAHNMNILPWTIFVCSTASIGLLAMCARLFWLENQARQAKGVETPTANKSTPAKRATA